MKGRKKELWDKAEAERRRAETWLAPFIRHGQPKTYTKAELRDSAMRELKISKHAFDAAWIGCIEDAGRPDWYEPLRRRKQTSN